MGSYKKIKKHTNIFPAVIVCILFVLTLMSAFLIGKSKQRSLSNSNAQGMGQRVLQASPTTKKTTTGNNQPVKGKILTDEKKTETDNGETSITAVGDSIIKSASSELKKIYGNDIVINGRVGRQVAEGIQVLTSLKKTNTLGGTVVVELGTNGTFTSKQFDQIMALLEDVEKVLFITNKAPRSWINGNNEMIKKNAKNYDTVVVFDWNAVSRGHPEYFAADEIHLTPLGAKIFAQKLSESL